MGDEETESAATVPPPSPTFHIHVYPQKGDDVRVTANQHFLRVVKHGMHIHVYAAALASGQVTVTGTNVSLSHQGAGTYLLLFD